MQILYFSFFKKINFALSHFQRSMADYDGHKSDSSSRDFSVLLRALSQLQDAHLAVNSGTTTPLLPTLPTIVAIGNQSDGKSSTIGMQADFFFLHSVLFVKKSARNDIWCLF